MKTTIAIALLSFGACRTSLEDAFDGAQAEEPPLASGGVLSPEQAAYDVQHYGLQLSVDPEKRRIDGALEMRARVVAPLDEVVLDLDGRLEVTGVSVDGTATPFQHERGQIRIDHAARAGSELLVRVEYGGEPRVAPNPPWDGGFTWETAADGSPWIATSCQGQGADLWWPCKDHPSDKAESLDLWISVPDGLICAANGHLVGEQVRDRQRTFHWRIDSPINNYGVALNIARYEVLESSFESVAGGEVPVYFWVLPEHLEEGRAILPEFLDHMEFFEDVLGPYPFRNEKYGVVETPHLGMEHPTIIAYGNQFREGKFEDYDWLHHHELSHEWWANLVTCSDWKDMWLHEGFGTYMQALYLERKFGAQAYRDEMSEKRAGLRNARAIAPREPTDSREIYFSTRGSDTDIYFKGSWVLHTLRWLVGDEAFFLVLRRMAYPDPALERVADGSQIRFVDTEDFRALAEKLTQRDLEWFFDVYVRSAELPRLEVTRRGRELELEWRVPGTALKRSGAFQLPVPVRVAGGPIERVEMPGGRGTLTLAAEDTPFEIDPEARLLRAE